MAREDEEIAALILVNGPPGIGKSTLARRYADEHALTLLVEVDGLRSSLGRWEEEEESKLLARSLAVALAQTHLGAGHDVIIPQYLGRLEFIVELDGLAARLGAELVEVVLLTDRPTAVRRFRERRAALAASGDAHPQGDVDEDAIEAVVDDAIDRLQHVVEARPRTITLDASDSVESTYRRMLDALARP